MAAMTSIATDIFDTCGRAIAWVIHFHFAIEYPTAFQTYKSATDVFAQAKFPKDIFNNELCYRPDELVIGSCRTIQGVI